MECNVVKKNLGVSRCNKMPEMIVGMITTPNDFTIPAATLNGAASGLLTYLNNAILDPIASRIYYWPDFKGFENVSTEAVYEDTPYAYLPVRDGQYRFKFMIKENLCLHKAMYTHRANNGRVILIDNENQLILSENADGDGIGFKVQMLHTEKLIINDGSVTTKSPILVALQNNKELDKTGVVVSFDNVGELHRIVDATVEVVTITDAGDIDVSIKAECDDTPISGLVVADFTYLNAAGASVTISTAVESTGIPGQYKLTQVGDLFVDGTVNIDPPDVLTIQAYESTGAAAVNIP